MTRFYLWVIFIGAIIPCGLYIYSTKFFVTYEKATQKRSDLHEKINEEEILIGVAWSNNEEENLFIKGAQSAVEILNHDEFNNYVTDEKKTIKRKLKLVLLPDGQKSAKAIAKNPKIAAVIGHNGSGYSIPASITYNYNGIPYLSPVSTSNQLTQHNFSYVFRNAPRDSDYTKSLIEFCYKKNFKRIAVIYCREPYGINFSNIFVEAVGLMEGTADGQKDRLEIILQKSYSESQKVFLSLIAEVIESKPDCILIAGLLPQAGLLIKQIRQMGLKAPIIGADGLDSATLTDYTGPYTGEIYVASVFDRNHKYEDGSLFANAKENLKQKKIEVDYDASQGFEAVFILAQAFKKTQSTHPLTITSFMKVYDEFQGINGMVSFSQDGNIEGKKVFIKELINGSFDKINE